MNTQELYDKLRMAFNWPPFPLTKYPYEYPRGGGKNRKWMEGNDEQISSMREDITEFAKGLSQTSRKVTDLTTLTTGYYFQKFAGKKYIGAINYYDANTKTVTMCNLYPSHEGQSIPYHPPNAFFFNKFPLKNLMLGEYGPPTLIGQTYIDHLPHSSFFINWVHTNPLSSRK